MLCICDGAAHLWDCLLGWARDQATGKSARGGAGLHFNLGAVRQQAGRCAVSFVASGFGNKTLA